MVLVFNRPGHNIAEILLTATATISDTNTTDIRRLIRDTSRQTSSIHHPSQYFS